MKDSFFIMAINTPEIFVANYLLNYTFADHPKWKDVGDCICERFPYLSILYLFRNEEAFDTDLFLNSYAEKIKNENEKLIDFIYSFSDYFKKDINEKLSVYKNQIEILENEREQNILRKSSLLDELSSYKEILLEKEKDISTLKAYNYMLLAERKVNTINKKKENISEVYLKERLNIDNSTSSDTNDHLIFRIQNVSFKMIRVNDLFYIGEVPVTQELWTVVMENNPSCFKSKNFPVEQVSIDDCKEFIEKLNSITGKDFRLPTSSEWETAANGGENGGSYKYSGSNIIEDVAWYKDEGGGSTYQVRSKVANILGIYDMCGNVWEWCSDSKSNRPSNWIKYRADHNFGVSYVVRGGSWDSAEQMCRISHFTYCPSKETRNNLGFRLCLSK